MSECLDAVYQMAAFLLFQAILLHLVEKSHFERPIRIFSGFLFILILCSVLFSLLERVTGQTKDVSTILERAAQKMEQAMQQREGESEKENFRLQLDQMEEDSRQEIEKEYEERVLQEAKNCLDKEQYVLLEGQVILGEGLKVEQIHLTVSRIWEEQGEKEGDETGKERTQRNTSSVQTIEEIERVQIGRQDSGKNAAERHSYQNQTGEEERLAEQLADWLGLTQPVIIVHVKEN